MEKTISGVEVILQNILRLGIDHVFTVDAPGVARLISALDAAAGDDLEVVRAKDEIAAAAMADAFTFSSRKISAVLTAGGGRALAQVSAVTNAWADKVPILSLSICEDEPPDMNKGVDRRRFDQTEVFRAVTRWRARASSLEEIPALLHKACAESVGARMGPVHIDIPAGLLGREAAAAAFPNLEGIAQPAFSPLRMRADEQAVGKAVSLLLSAERPFCFCGAGVMRSSAEALLARFLSRTGIPVSNSMAGMGCVASDHECYVGGPSYAAGEVFHTAIRKADVVLALGTAFGGLEGFGRPPLWSRKIKFIHVDIDPLQIGLNTSPEVALQGDVKTVLEQFMTELMARNSRFPSSWTAWREKLLTLRQARTERLLKDAYIEGGGIHQGRLAYELGQKVVDDDLLMVIDGGNTALYAAIYAPRIKPGQVFFPFGMAALGAGVPATVGLQLANPDRRVMLCTGDGSMLYNVQELATIADLGLPIIIVVNNDSAWNMIRCAQTAMYAGRYIGTDLPEIDYAGIARGFGFHSETVTRGEDLVPAYERARDLNGPALLNVITDKINYPDSVISFAMVEFEGAQMNTWDLLHSLWLGRKDGWQRIRSRGIYIWKSFIA